MSMQDKLQSSERLGRGILVNQQRNPPFKEKLEVTRINFMCDPDGTLITIKSLQCLPNAFVGTTAVVDYLVAISRLGESSSTTAWASSLQCGD